VALPEGSDPADIVASEGVEALRARVQASVPFVSFNVDRILERADTGSAEGRDAAFAELRPVVGEMGPSLLRDELMRRIAGRLELSDAQLTSLLMAAHPSGSAGPSGGSAGSPVSATGVPRNGSAGNGSPPGASPPPISQTVRQERLFLAQCVAVPEPGVAALARIDIDELLTSKAMRSAAHQLRGRLRTPLADLPAGDEGLARTIADIVAQAGRVPDPSAERLEHTRLVLELGRLERAINRARADGTGISALAAERERVREEMQAVVARLEKTL
jgi:DNA primase